MTVSMPYERLLALYQKDDARNNDPNLNCVDGHEVPVGQEPRTITNVYPSLISST